MIAAVILGMMIAQATVDLPAAMKIMEQLPSAVAILAVVSLFIKHLSSESKANREHLSTESRANREFFKEIHAEHIDQRVLTRQAMERMVETTKENIVATKENSATLSNLARSIDVVLNSQHQHHHKGT